MSVGSPSHSPRSLCVSLIQPSYQAKYGPNWSRVSGSGRWLKPGATLPKVLIGVSIASFSACVRVGSAAGRRLEEGEDVTGRLVRNRRGVRLTIALVAAAAVAGITTGMFAFAASTAALKKVPPRQAAKATEAAQVKKPEAQSPNTGVWGGVTSKVVPLPAGGAVVTGLSLPAGTFALTVSGSLWTTSGQGTQNVGCHIMIGKDSYGDAYLSVDNASLGQQSYSIIAWPKLTAQATAQLVCTVGKTPVDQISTQANFLATKLG
jgi:hypothetical protein